MAKFPTPTRIDLMTPFGEIAKLSASLTQIVGSNLTRDKYLYKLQVIVSDLGVCLGEIDVCKMYS